jgi:hypothetical protein
MITIIAEDHHKASTGILCMLRFVREIATTTFNQYYPTVRNGIGERGASTPRFGQHHIYGVCWW